MNTLTPPHLITRRQVLRFGGLSLLGIALGAFVPATAFAYPFEITTVDERDIINARIFPVLLDGNLCGSEPDSITVSGNSNFTVGYHQPSLVWKGAWSSPSASMNGLVVDAVYNRVGTNIENNRQAGVRVHISNFVKVTDSVQNWLRSYMGSTKNGVGLGKFSESTMCMWFEGIESADFEYEFFYTDNPSENISAQSTIVTMMSLNSYDFGGQHLVEGFSLPEEVTKLYVPDTFVGQVDQALTGRQTYEHACYGWKFGDINTGVPNQRALSVSWECPTDAIKVKPIALCSRFGFNISFNPIFTTTPESPIKEYSIER